MSIVGDLLQNLENEVQAVSLNASVKMYSSSELRNPSFKPDLPCISIAYTGITPSGSDRNLVPAVTVGVYYIGLDECENSLELKSINEDAVTTLDTLRKRITNLITPFNRPWEFKSEMPIVINEKDGRSIMSIVQSWQVLVPHIGRS